MPEPISDEKVTWDNIFEDFVSDESLWEDIKTIDKQQQRDSYYYLSILNIFFKVVNLLLFIWIVLFYSYSYIQNREDVNKDEPKQYSILEPMCGLFLWESKSEVEWCYGVTSRLEYEENQLEKLKKDQDKEIYGILPDVYTIENFTNSESIIFLLTKTKEKAEYVHILSEFDRLKNEFASTDRSRIVCSGLTIDKNLELSIECEVLSTYLEKVNDIDKILTRERWTSLTIASLFVEFLDRDWTFSLIDKQKTFETKKVEWYYKKWTTVSLKMKYNKPGDLAF